MHIGKASVAAIVSLAVAGCSIPAAGADLVLTNGRVYTVDSRQPWAEAIAIDDGEIVFVGTNDDAQSHIEAGTRHINLKGKMVLPGLHDVHMHPLEAGNPAAGACILDEHSDLQNLTETLGDCADGGVGTDWVTGWGFDLAVLAKTKIAPADLLEAAIPGRPAILMERTSHSQWVNRTALRRAGITRHSPDPVGGRIVRDRSGEPNGILLDNAGDQVLELVYRPTPELLGLARDGLVAKLREFPAYGLTSIADARVYWTRGHHKVWQRVAREGQLPVRAVLGLWAYPELSDDQLTEFHALFSDDPDSLLRISQIKFYVDGILPNGTARVIAPYRSGTTIGGDAHGLNYFDKDRLTRYLVAIEEMGYDAHIHAIGDLGISEALDAIEAASATHPARRSARYRITHIEVRNQRYIDRFAKLGVVADFQVAGDWTAPDTYFRDIARYIGNGARDAIPLRSIFDTGATVTLSSDYDVSDPNPFIGMAHALARGRESLPNVDAAIRAYTINAAYTLRQEDRVGSLTVGKRADLIVIDRNIFEVPVDRIAQTKVLLTLLDGRETYRAPGF